MACLLYNTHFCRNYDCGSEHALISPSHSLTRGSGYSTLSKSRWDTLRYLAIRWDATAVRRVDVDVNVRSTALLFIAHFSPYAAHVCYFSWQCANFNSFGTLILPSVLGTRILMGFLRIDNHSGLKKCSYQIRHKIGGYGSTYFIMRVVANGVHLDLLQFLHRWAHI